MGKKNNRSDKPKRALTPYIKFCSETRPQIKASNPNISFGEMGRQLGKLWRELDNDTKQGYQKS